MVAGVVGPAGNEEAAPAPVKRGGDNRWRRCAECLGETLRKASFYVFFF